MFASLSHERCTPCPLPRGAREAEVEAVEHCRRFLAQACRPQVKIRPGLPSRWLVITLLSARTPYAVPKFDLTDAELRHPFDARRCKVQMEQEHATCGIFLSPRRSLWSQCPSTLCSSGSYADLPGETQGTHPTCVGGFQQSFLLLPFLASCELQPSAACDQLFNLIGSFGSSLESSFLHGQS